MGCGVFGGRRGAPHIVWFGILPLMHARLIAMLLVLVHAFAGIMPLARGEAAPSAATPEKCCCCEAGSCGCGCDDDTGDQPPRDDGPRREPGENPVCPCSPRIPVPVRVGNGSEAVVAAVAGGVIRQARRHARDWNNESTEHAAGQRDVARLAAFDDGPSRLHATGSRLVWHCRWQV